MMYGGRISLAVGFAAMLVALIVGVLVGSVAGMSSGWVDAALMWLTDLFLALPTLPLLLLVMYLFRDSMKKVLGRRGRRLRADRGGDRRPALDAGGAPGARPVPVAAREGVRRGGPRAGRLQGPPGGAAHPAQRAGAGDRGRHHRRGGRHHLRIRPCRSWAWASRPTSRPGARMLRDAKDYLDIAAALGAVPGRRDLPHRAGDQLHRRRAARRASIRAASFRSKRQRGKTPCWTSAV